MSRYTVVWTNDALDQLADFWLQADDRAELTAAANRIERLLRIDPMKVGLPVSGELFGLRALPLRVLYRVSAADCLVEVALVRRTR